MEGYEPPHDHRLKRFAITPDPGVIEVNIHPAHSWGELLSNTQAVYKEARLARLATEKFMLDGRHTGTGGGNHVTIGGATPADSPMLRRPDVLQSLVTYWQHHPGLSYLFLRAVYRSRPARRQEWMRRVTTVCMSWKLPFSKCPKEKHRRRGLLIACSETCLLM